MSEYDWYLITYNLATEPMVQRVHAMQLDEEVKKTIRFRAPAGRDIRVYGVNRIGELVPARTYRR